MTNEQPEPEHNIAHDGDGYIYGFWDEDGYWEFWSPNANLIGQYDTWADAIRDFPELAVGDDRRV